jgi:hypothetical protein
MYLRFAFCLADGASTGLTSRAVSLPQARCNCDGGGDTGALWLLPGDTGAMTAGIGGWNSFQEGCIVSGHDFSRAEKDLKTWGFSPSGLASASW